MTLDKFIKELQKLQANGYGKTNIVIDVKSASEKYKQNDEWTHRNLEKIETETIRWERNGSFELANGQERLKTIITLS